MRLALMLCIAGLATNCFAQKKRFFEKSDSVRLVTVKYYQANDAFQITEMSDLNGGEQSYGAPASNLTFSSGNGIIVHDMDRLKKLLSTKSSALFLPNHKSVPVPLRTMLAPETIVILRKESQPKERSLNPIFAARDKSRVQWYQPDSKPEVTPAYGYQSISGATVVIPDAVIQADTERRVREFREMLKEEKARGNRP